LILIKAMASALGKLTPMNTLSQRAAFGLFDARVPGRALARLRMQIAAGTF